MQRLSLLVTILFLADCANAISVLPRNAPGDSVDQGESVPQPDHASRASGGNHVLHTALGGARAPHGPIAASASAEADEVTDVPGYDGTPPAKQYAGYVTVDEAHGRRSYHPPYLADPTFPWNQPCLCRHPVHFLPGPVNRTGGEQALLLPRSLGERPCQRSSGPVAQWRPWLLLV